MRAIVGFVAFHGALVAVGLAVLSACRLLPGGARSTAAAIGPAFLAGTSVVVVTLIALLVLGVPFTLATAIFVGVAWTVVGFSLGRRHGTKRVAASTRDAQPTVTAAHAWVARAAWAAGAVYVAFGAFALSRAPTVGDDARLWSLKGLALTYYDNLRPEIFQSPLGSVAHPVYPVFQPVFEALFNRAMGQPELRLFHTELWLLMIAAIWTAAYLLWLRRPRPQLWLSALALIAAVPAVLVSVSGGFADATGSVLVGVGALALGLWIDTREVGYLGIASVVLAAAANTKDEDMVAVALVLIAAGVTLALSGQRKRLRPLVVAAAFCAALVAPWRIWAVAHRLTDSVTPPIPRALSPIYILDRLPQLHRTLSAMMTQILAQWSWFAAIFIATCAISLLTRTARRVTAFYLVSAAAVIISLLWLYTTTPLNVASLVPSTMSRTVDIFMALTPFATAHLLAKLTTEPPRPHGQRADQTRPGPR